MCILYIFTFWETEQKESPFFTIQENSHSCFITVPSLIMGLWKYTQKEMNMWNEKGEMNVSCSDISAILVQMSARLSSPPIKQQSYQTASYCCCHGDRKV